KKEIGKGRDAFISADKKLKEKISKLIENLANPEAKVHNNAIYDLAYLGPKAIPALSRALNDPREPVRVRAIRALFYMGNDASAEAPAILKNIRDPHSSFNERAEAAVYLGQQKTVNQSVIDALTDAAIDGAKYGKDKLRSTAAVALLMLYNNGDANMRKLMEKIVQDKFKTAMNSLRNPDTGAEHYINEEDHQQKISVAAALKNIMDMFDGLKHKKN
ncbi:MAG: HEAT repeat domain-containing protein, partial [Parcubacteria group bacterium]